MSRCFVVLCLCALAFGCKSRDKAPEPAVEVEQATARDAGAPVRDAGASVSARTFATAREAIEHILASKPRVIGFGEFHQTTDSAPVRSSIERFAGVFDAVSASGAGSKPGQEPGPISDLIVETWVEEGNCGETEQAVSQDVKTVTKRPAVVENHVLNLLKRAKTRGVTPHVMTMKCEDYEAVLQPSGEVDYEKMLDLIKRKLAETAALVWSHRQKTGDQRAILLYGGSLHNDLYPYDGLESFSYVADVARLAGDGYVEVDLYVPEYIAGNPLLIKQPWYPEFERRASTDHVVLIERGPRSYIVILRKGLP